MTESSPMQPLDANAVDPTDRILGLSRTAWVQIATVAILVCALFRFNLTRLWDKTNPYDGQDSNWQHSVFVPLIGLYYLYIHREELTKAASKPRRADRTIRFYSVVELVLLGLILIYELNSLSGNLFVAPVVLILGLILGAVLSIAIPRAGVRGAAHALGGLLVFIYGIYPGQNDYFKDVGMVMTIFGLATLLAGWEVIKVAWFPIAFLLVAVPWPDMWYSNLASPLQQLAASAAVGTLRLCGVEAMRFDTKIWMSGAGNQGRMLNVAEACAGLRSLMTFLMVGGTVAFLSSRPIWEKLVVTLAAVPIAIFCNMLRVAGQGLLDRYVSVELSEGFAHQFVGLFMLIPGFFLILAVGWLIDKMFISEADLDKLKDGKFGSRSEHRKVIQVPRRKDAAETTPPASEGVAVGAPAVVDRAEPALTPDLPAPAAVATTAAAMPTVLPSPTVAAPAANRPAVAKPTVARALAAPSRPQVGSVSAPQAPVAPAPARPAASPAPAAAKPAAPRPAAASATPAAPAQRPAPQAAPAAPARPAPAAPGVSTLKPSSKPMTPRAPVVPAGLKPSHARPAGVPLPPSGLKPAAPRPAPATPGTPAGAEAGNVDVNPSSPAPDHSN